jgi:Domain of unknown function (DUF4920)
MRTPRTAWMLGLALLLAACGKAPSAPPEPGKPPVTDGKETVYGTPLATAETFGVADVVKRGGELNGKKVRVEGTIADVCAKRGCWIKIADESGPTEITFKVEDGVMVFPMDAKGKWVVADGEVRRTELTLEQTRRRREAEAKESGKPFDPASVTEGGVSVRLNGIGARVRDRK